jgi:hypothetical protein
MKTLVLAIAAFVIPSVTSAADTAFDVFGVRIGAPLSIQPCPKGLAMIDAKETCHWDPDGIMKSIGVFGSILAPTKVPKVKPWGTNIVYLHWGDAYDSEYTFGVDEAEILSGTIQNITFYTNSTSFDTVVASLQSKWGKPKQIKYDPTGKIVTLMRWEYKSIMVQYFPYLDWEQLPSVWQERFKHDTWKFGGMVRIYTQEWANVFDEWSEKNRKPPLRPL